MKFENFFERCRVETSDFDMSFAENNFEWRLLKSKHDNLQIDNSGTIPKVIHFMWIGSDLPKIYKQNINIWKEKNPSFDIMIWDDEKTNKFLSDKSLYGMFKESTSFGVKSDVARYHVLKEIGGLYLDTDFLCLSSEFDFLHDNLSFYSCCSFEKNLNIFNGMIASEPNHPIIDLCIANCDINRAADIQCDQTKVLYQTGPYLFTRCVLSYLSQSQKRNEVILPSEAFYPFPAVLRNETSEGLLNKFIKPHSLACHLWHSSWQPKSMYYKGIKNDN